MKTQMNTRASAQTKHRFRCIAAALVLHTSVCAGALLAHAPLARAQHDSATTPTDVPAGSASIRGRVVHAQRAEAGADLEVVLYALPPTGVPGVRRARTDASGAFVFSNISNDPAIPYLVGARFADVPFPGERVVFEAGETEHSLEIHISDATTEGAAVRVLDVQIVLTRAASGVHVEETHRLRNPGTRVVYVPPAGRDAQRPAWSTSLPASATHVEHPLGMKPEGMRVDGTTVTFHGPVYVGEQELSFSYDVPLESVGAALTRTLPAGADRVRILAGADVGALHAKGFTPIEPVKVDERTLPAIEARNIAKGREIAVALELPAMQRDPGALAVDEIRLQVELDEEALLFAREEYVLRVDGKTPLVGAPDAPLLRIALPSGAEDIRFSAETQALGLSVGDDGGLALLGPIGPGDVTVEFLYRLPLAGGDVRFDRSFERGTPLLTVYVADSGVVTESARLHRRRPIRTQDGPYMIHLEAFDVEPGESVPLHIVASPPAAAGGGAGVLAGVLAASAAAVALLLSPLSGRQSDAPREPDVAPERRERESLYAALRDLEDDFETGKVTADDHVEMRDDLRARALVLLEAERAAARSRPTMTGSNHASAVTQPAEAQRDAAARFCTGCGAHAGPDDRFCARCGVRLRDDAGEGAAPA